MAPVAVAAALDALLKAYHNPAAVRWGPEVHERARRRHGQPAGNEKARYQVAKECPEDRQEWLRHAENCHGLWWPDYASWLAERCGEERAAPQEPVGTSHDRAVFAGL